MDHEEESGWKRSSGGQIPAFGNWEQANELPITQYFECARQAGLIRFSSSSSCSCAGCRLHKHGYRHKYYNHHQRPLRYSAPLPRQRNNSNNEGCSQFKEGKKKQQHVKEKVQDVTDQRPLKHHHRHKDIHVISHRPLPTAADTKIKSLDEDLYKIPQELLHNTTKRKKKLGIFSRCLMPACMV